MVGLKSIRERIQNILEAMKVGMLERDEVIALSLLSALAGESIFLLGLPGVGKSMVARRLKIAFAGAKSFEYLMSRFSTPDEIFGPVSISKLKDSDCYERITTGYLPDAEIVFLDEIWKAGPAIQNALLTVLNEKIYLNGRNELHLPIKGIISASNELPAENEGLEALWDRFLLRYIVNPLNEKRNFAALIAGGINAEDMECRPLSQEEYNNIIVGVRTVTVPEEIVELLFKIRERMNKKMTEQPEDEKEPERINQKYYVSDRRWKKAVGIMKTSAFLNGRVTLDLSDILLLRHILWNEDKQVGEINSIITEEVVSSIFNDILEKLKSAKRHAAKQVKNTFYSPDRIHYIVQCDDSQLKLKITDYNRMLKDGEYYFGSETLDGRILISNRGSYSIRVIKDGFVVINSFSYPLQTDSDRQITNDFLKSMGDTLDDIARRIYVNIADNMFVCDTVNNDLVAVVSLYKSRIENS